MKNIEDLIKLLSSPAWTVHELIKYGELTGTRFGRSTAYKIMHEIKLKGGKVRYSTNAVTSDAALNYFGLSREREIRLLSDVIATRN